jgi:putative aldouronate transport system permease protein
MVDIMEKNKFLRSWIVSIYRYKYLYLLLIPALLYYIIFHYIPLYGVVLSFKDFQISKGILGSPWADPPTRHFLRLFRNPDFWRAVKNTFIISTYKIVFAFPAPIILALLLNEIVSMRFRKTVQTIMYLPHFISWVVIGGILMHFLSIDNGIINNILGVFGIPPRQYMTEPRYFRAILIISHIWKNMGWGTIIYLAALAGVDLDLYAAATIDGVNRFQMVWYVTLPQIRSTIAVMLILNLGRIILNAGFEQIFIMYNPSVYEVSDIINTLVYRMGIESMQYAVATAAGLFRSLIACFLIVTSNMIVKRMGERGIY